MATDGQIEPSSFDVIVLGTGLQEAMLAAASAAAGLSVLHLEPQEFYGAHWTSLDLKQFSSWAASGGRFPAVELPAPKPSVSLPEDEIPPEESPSTAAAGDSTDFSGGNADHDSSASEGIDLESNSRESAAESVGDAEKKDGGDNLAAELGQLREIPVESAEGIFSGVRVWEFEGVELGKSRAYSLDLCGPRLTFCGSDLVSIMVRSGASHYVEFKGVDVTYMWSEGGGMSAVPSSRADVFKDKSLSLPDKRFLMRFFKLVTDYANSNEGSADVSTEDLDGWFLDFMRRQQLPASIQA